MITYVQAVFLGLLQGVTELFPISSLGHTVLIPYWFGWTDVVNAQSADSSYFLAFVVALHVATALALLFHYWRTWVRIIGGFFSSIRKRRIETPDERLAWLLVVGTIPIGIIGLGLEHALRTLFAKPTASAVFLMLNGVILYLGERLRRRTAEPVGAHGIEPPGRELDTLELKEGAFIGVAQAGALLAGVSRSGITMVGGLLRGLNHEDAARFAFLLATPVILAAGLYKVPDLLGHTGDGVRGQALAGAVAAFFAALFAVKFLEKYFERRTLTPFAIYCLAAGALSLVKLGFF